MMSSENFKWAANEMYVSAGRAVDSALDADKLWDRDQFLTVAAQSLRDAQTFMGRANSIDNFGDDTVYPDEGEAT